MLLSQLRTAEDVTLASERHHAVPAGWLPLLHVLLQYQLRGWRWRLALAVKAAPLYASLADLLAERQLPMIVLGANANARCRTANLTAFPPAG
jgi:hypothetical protein